jgi:hypothetical protein
MCRGKLLKTGEGALMQRSWLPMLGGVLMIAHANGCALPANWSTNSIEYGRLAPDSTTNLTHPRLYFTTNDLRSLRADRFHGERKKIWKNLAQSADWCLTREPRQAWIAPVSPDPEKTCSSLSPNK